MRTLATNRLLSGYHRSGAPQTIRSDQPPLPPRQDDISCDENQSMPCRFERATDTNNQQCRLHGINPPAVRTGFHVRAGTFTVSSTPPAPISCVDEEYPAPAGGCHCPARRGSGRKVGNWHHRRPQRQRGSARGWRAIRRKDFAKAGLAARRQSPRGRKIGYSGCWRHTPTTIAEKAMVDQEDVSLPRRFYKASRQARISRRHPESDCPFHRLTMGQIPGDVGITTL